jgi:hypothetical protein
MRPEPTSAQVGARLAEAARDRRTSLAALSRMIGKPSGYLGRFVREGRPERLDDADRANLARFLGVDERELGKWDNPPKD